VHFWPGLVEGLVLESDLRGVVEVGGVIGGVLFLSRIRPLLQKTGDLDVKALDNH
jgi:hypothetical protein